MLRLEWVGRTQRWVGRTWRCLLWRGRGWKGMAVNGKDEKAEVQLG